MMIPKPTFDEELPLWEQGYHVIGVDEVGRGAFAGPLVVGAVVFPRLTRQSIKEFSEELAGVHDSKLLRENVRILLSSKLRTLAKIIKIVEIPVSVINKVGVGRANQIGFRSAIREVQKECAGERLFVLADGFQTKYVRGIGIKKQKAIIKGDQKSFSIASASILAKVYRDTLMKQLGQQYEKYAFARHKGYGTLLHRKLLQEHGMCDLHRIAFCHSTLHRVA